MAKKKAAAHQSASRSRLTQEDRGLIAYALEALATEMKQCARDPSCTKKERQQYAQTQADCVGLAAMVAAGKENG